MKSKLYKGPFNGKSYTTDGRNEIIIRGPKPMSRRQKWEWEMKNYSTSFQYPPKPFPTVEARYRICMRSLVTENNIVTYVPLYHPDGSMFYEYVEGSKREC